MDTFFKFLLTEWAGAPLAIWFLGVVAGLLIIIILVMRRLRIVTGHTEVELETRASAKKAPRRPASPALQKIQ